jgi:ABC-type transport system substrate-binding protein
MRSRLLPVCAVLSLLLSIIAAAPHAWSAQPHVERLIFASAGFHEGNRFWTIAKPDHLQFDPFLETLLEVDPKTAEYTPRLATKWSHSPDFKEWTFYLRDDVQFHFGFGPFTARDVVHSHSLMLRPDTTATLAPFWRTAEEVKAIDDHTVLFRFKNPVPPATMLYAVSRAGDLRMVSKAQWDKEGLAGFDKRPAGTGSYQYAGRQPGLNITFTRFDKHWSEKPFFKELEFRIAREEATRLALLLSGDAHIADLPRELHKEALSKGLKRFSSTIPVDWVSVYMGGLYFLPGDKVFNKDVPWTNKKVRQALNMAVNRKELLDTVFAGRGTLAYVSSWLPRSEGWNPAWEKRFNELYGYNPAKAKQLLSEAGYGPGKLKFKLWAFTEPGESEGPAIADALSIYFKNVGVDAEVELLDWAKIRAAIRKKEVSCCMWPNIITWRPADQAVRNFWHAKGTTHAFEDEFIATTFSKLDQTVDPNERQKLAQAIGNHLFENFVDIPLFWFKNEVFANPKVVGDWVYPGLAAGRSTHFAQIRPAGE